MGAEVFEGSDSAIFNLLNDENFSNENSHDTWTNFSIGNGDEIDVSSLLADGTSIVEAITVNEDTNGNVVLMIDRDGASNNAYQSEEFITLDGISKTDHLLEDLINNGHLL